MVAVRRGTLFERHAAIDRAHERCVHDVDDVVVDRVGGDVHVVPGAGPQDAVAVHQLPALAPVVAAVQAALTWHCLHDGVQPAGIAGAHVDADLADELRQTLGQLLPGVATVRRLEDTARVATGEHIPGLPAVLPHGRVEDPRVAGIHPQVGGAGLGVDCENLIPGLSTIGCPIDTALLVRSPDLPLDRCIGDVGVARMDLDAGDLPSLWQPDMCPGLAAVRRFVHAVAMAGSDPSDRLLPSTDVDDVGVRRRHGNGADRADVEVVVGEILPGQTGVLRLPQATAGGTHVVKLWVLGYACDGGHAAAAEGTHQAPFHGRKKRCVDRLFSSGRRREPRRGDDDHDKNSTGLELSFHWTSLRPL